MRPDDYYAELADADVALYPGVAAVLADAAQRAGIRVAVFTGSSSRAARCC